MIKAVIPTFHLNGHCQEAIELYKAALGLEVDYQDVNEKTGLIRHTKARIGEQRLRLSDGVVENAGTKALFLAVVFDTPDEVDRAFKLLAEGGTVVQRPYRPEFATYMSELYDKFGFRWFLMVN